MSVEDYERLPYAQNAFWDTHPRVLAAMATILGRADVPDVNHCKVLEIGCASGLNSISMAIDLPGSTFVGIDFSPRQIDQGREIVTALGLSNIDLQVANILEIDASFGQFDYIIAHGIYSWVPDNVKNKLLDLCRTNLTPQGIAYVSHNANPLWRLVSVVRDMMKFHARHWQDGDEQLRKAREFIGLLARTVPDDPSQYGAVIRHQHELMKDLADNFIAHDIFEEVNDPVYMIELVEHARRHDLQYLGDVATMKGRFENMPEAYTREVASCADDVVEMEQYMDFYLGRRFRSTLLCHADVPVDAPCQPSALDGLYITCEAEPVADSFHPQLKLATKFRNSNGDTVELQNPMAIITMSALVACWPEAISLAVLTNSVLGWIRQTRLTGSNITAETLRGFLPGFLYTAYWHRHIRFTSVPLCCVRDPGPRPKASPLARYQAARTNSVLNLRQSNVELSEAHVELFRLLDGSRDRQTLLEMMQGKLSEAEFDSALNLFGRQALLYRDTGAA